MHNKAKHSDSFYVAASLQSRACWQRQATEIVMCMTINCIFCREDRPPTDEHVVPEFAGGSLLIKNVCKRCNDNMGSDFEGPISRSVIFRLPRHLYGIQGKSDNPINAFPNVGTAKDGSKIRVDSEFRPYMTTSVEERRLESGDVQVDLKVDAKDKDKIPEIIEAKIRRIARSEWPNMSKEEVDTLVRNSLESLPKEYEVKSSQPTIGYRESIDLNHLTLLMMKIAYEIAFHHHGEDVLEDSEYARLRETIYSRDTKSKISGSIFPQPDPFVFVTSPDNCHCVMLCKNICYVRLFNVTAIIEVYGKESVFSLDDENWALYLFDYKAKSWRKENFIEYLHSAIA
ncbi:MAG: HNH endonuclease [Pseudohongiella sp.]|nr:HNH endonuclease [Pseudohongiella sp.]